jgi:hypothetical protein
MGVDWRGCHVRAAVARQRRAFPKIINLAAHASGGAPARSNAPTLHVAGGEWASGEWAEAKELIIMGPSRDDVAFTPPPDLLSL